MDTYPVVGVVGGCGGVGCSTFAAALAIAAARRSGSALLADLDPCGGGIDTVLGVDAEAGARWSGLMLGGGHLDPADLTAGLPRWGPVSVLACDGGLITPGTAASAVQAAASAGAVVLDLARASSATVPAVLPLCTLVVLVVRADLIGLTAARATARLVLDLEPDARIGALVRAGGRVDASRAADVVGAALLGRLPTSERVSQPMPVHACPAALVRVAGGVLDGIAA